MPLASSMPPAAGMPASAGTSLVTRMGTTAWMPEADETPAKSKIRQQESSGRNSVIQQEPHKGHYINIIQVQSYPRETSNGVECSLEGD